MYPATWNLSVSLDSTMVICDQTTWVTTLSLYIVDKVFQSLLSVVMPKGTNIQQLCLVATCNTTSRILVNKGTDSGKRQLTKDKRRLWFVWKKWALVAWNIVLLYLLYHLNLPPCPNWCFIHVCWNPSPSLLLNTSVMDLSLKSLFMETYHKS